MTRRTRDKDVAEKRRERPSRFAIISIRVPTSIVFAAAPIHLIVDASKARDSGVSVIAVNDHGAPRL
jgi:hypothetical protein